MAEDLETAYDGIAADWQRLARRLGQDETATLSHTLSCAANASDFGLMLAWSRLLEGRAKEEARLLVVCDDPWLFRHLALRPGVLSLSRPPALWALQARLRARGFAARLWFLVRAAGAAMRFRGQRRRYPAGHPAILVYGHPASAVDGTDGYFWTLLCDLPQVWRVLHVDCPASRASELASGARTVSLAAWGSGRSLIRLLGARWRPKIDRDAEDAWLIRRAAEIEGGTAQAAAVLWQSLCQRAWLGEARPAAVTWPWENHGWERDLVRQARSLGLATAGYQHSTVGNREWNHAPASNPDGLTSIPDRILVNGPVSNAALAAFGCPAERLEDVGALRVQAIRRLVHDKEGPVFVALPFDREIARQMVAAVRPLGVLGRRFRLKVHPMKPLAVEPGPGLETTLLPLAEQGGLAAVLYAATTVGLEALLGGLPTIRFRPRGKVPTDVVPPTIAVPCATAETLGRILDEAAAPPPLDAGLFFTPPRIERWRQILAGA